MKTNKEIINSLVSKKKTKTVTRNKERIKNRARLRESQQIALKVLTKLDENGWTQRRLAKEMKVTPQQITKIVRGKENLTLETQVKLQEVLGIPILATYYENIFEQIVNSFKFKKSMKYSIPEFKPSEDNIIIPKVECKENYRELSEGYQTYSIPA